VPAQQRLRRDEKRRYLFSKGLPLPSFVTGNCQEFYEQIVPRVSMRSLSHLISLVQNWNLPTDQLVEAIRTYIVDILHNFAWSSTRGASDAQKKLQSVGLSAYGRVLGAMLPADLESLLDLLRRKNVHSASRYVSGIATSNKDLFYTVTDGVRDVNLLVEEAWRRYDGTTSFVANRVSFFRRFPLRIRKQLIQQAPAGAIEAWILIGIPVLAVQTLAILYSSTDDTEAGQARRVELRQLASARLDRATVHELRSLPRVLWRLRIDERSVFGSHVLRSLMSRAFIALEQLHDDEHAALRILYDIARTSERYRDVVLRRLVWLLSDNVRPSTSWDYWACCGLVHVLGGDVQPALPPMTDQIDRGFLQRWLEMTTPQEAALTVIGADHIGVDLEILPTGSASKNYSGGISIFITSLQ
jgi:hypothetical protein